MTATIDREELGARRLYTMIMYQGPWEKVTNWLWKVDKLQLDDNGVALNPECIVEDTSIRGRVAVWAERRDFAWRDRYVRSNRTPPKRWQRK